MEDKHLIDYDGWNTRAFACLLGVISELREVEYEIRHTKRSVTPTQMKELLVTLSNALKHEAESL